MKKIFLKISAAAILVSWQQPAGQKNDHGQMSMKTDSVAACCASKDGLFIHLSSGYENPHKAFMALKMAAIGKIVTLDY